jgi:hypothetical protein
MGFVRSIEVGLALALLIEYDVIAKTSDYLAFGSFVLAVMLLIYGHEKILSVYKKKLNECERFASVNFMKEDEDM